MQSNDALSRAPRHSSDADERGLECGVGRRRFPNEVHHRAGQARANQPGKETCSSEISYVWKFTA